VTLRRRLLLFGAIILLPLAAMLLLGVRRERQQALAQARDIALRDVRLAATDYENTLSEARHLLLQVAGLQLLRVEDWPSINGVLARLIQQDPAFISLRVNDLNGTALASGLPETPERSYGAVPGFRRAAQATGFTLSDYFIDLASGKSGVAAMLPIRSSDGRRQYVLSAAFSASAVRPFIPSEFPPGSTFNVLDQTGALIVREPDSEKWVGTQFPDGALRRALEERRPEGLLESSGADGITRLYAYKTLPLTPDGANLFLAIGIPMAQILAPANRTLALALAAIAVTFAFMLGTAVIGAHRLVLNPVSTLVSGMRTLAAGGANDAGLDALRGTRANSEKSRARHPTWPQSCGRARRSCRWSSTPRPTGRPSSASSPMGASSWKPSTPPCSTARGNSRQRRYRPRQDRTAPSG